MSHNGGTLQVNPYFLQVGRDYPFINYLKTAQEWGCADNSGAYPPDQLDDNGYPHTITNGGVSTVFFVPSQTSRPGRYVVRWTGDGTVLCTGTVFSGSLAGSNGRAVLTVADDANGEQPGSIRISLSITAKGASDYIRDLAFMHEDDEADWLAGEVFSTAFKAKLAEGGFGVIRFLDWQRVNISNISQVSQMTPESHYSYQAVWARPGLYAGATTNVGDAYTVAAPSDWSGLVDKATVVVKFNAASTATAPTLNVGGTGAKMILSGRTSQALSDGGNTLILADWRQYATLVYDEDLDAWLKLGADAASNNVQGWLGGVPVSLMVRLCNEVGAHPWLHAPHFALDPLTSFSADLATYCRDNLDTGLVPRFEPSNEVWNEGNDFFQTLYGEAKEVARGHSASGYHYWYGRALAKMGKAISAVYGDDRTRYQVVCGVKTTSANSAIDSDERLASTRYIAEGAAAGDAARYWATHVACAGYWNPRAQGDAVAEQALADEYVSATTARKAEILAEYVADNTLFQANWLGLSNADDYAAWKAWGAQLGVNGLCQYEGGWSPDYGAGGNIDTLRAASKDCPDLVRETLRNYQAFLDAGGEFPSVYLLAGANNAWSVLDPDIYVSPEPPQWTAAKMFKAGQRRFKVT